MSTKEIETTNGPELNSMGISSPFITVADFKEAVALIPDDRNDDLLAIWDTLTGERIKVEYIDLDCAGTVDLNIRNIDDRLENSVHCSECDVWATSRVDEVRHKMEGFEHLSNNDDGTANYKCEGCGTLLSSKWYNGDELAPTKPTNE